MEGDYPSRFIINEESGDPLSYSPLSGDYPSRFIGQNSNQQLCEIGLSMEDLPTKTDYSSQASLSYFSEECLSELQKYQLLLQSSSPSIVNGDSDNKHQNQTYEHLDYVEQRNLSSVDTSIEPYNYISGSSDDRNFKMCYSDSVLDHQLPVHRSIRQIFYHQEQEMRFTDNHFHVLDDHEPSHKRFRYSSSSSSEPTSDSYKFETKSVLKSKNAFVVSSPRYLTLKSLPAKLASSPERITQNVLAQQRRKPISDRTRCLQKLMPWDTKMDTAKTLEEAYKYIKFLQAQVSVLESMPCQSSFITNSHIMTVHNGGSSGYSNCDVFGGLEKLNRQQLLEILVNSSVAQSILSSQECCVYSMEQLILLKNNVGLQQMMMSSSSTTSSCSSSSRI